MYDAFASSLATVSGRQINSADPWSLGKEMIGLRGLHELLVTRLSKQPASTRRNKMALWSEEQVGGMTREGTMDGEC